MVEPHCEGFLYACKQEVTMEDAKETKETMFSSGMSKTY